MSDHRLFAEAVLAAFRDAGLYTDREVADAGGPSNTSMTALRKAARGEGAWREPRGDMLARIDRAAGWPYGSARVLWHEGRGPDRDVVVPGLRVELAGRIRVERRRRFGSKRAAYRAAAVSSATWERAERGEPVREDRLRQIVEVLWPGSGGDWSAVLTSSGEWRPAPSVDAVVAELDELRRRVALLEARLDPDGAAS